MTIELLNNYQKPVFTYMMMPALLDTGADVSVCNLTKEVFELIFVNNCKNIGRYKVTGYGGTSDGFMYTVLQTEIAGINFKNVKFFIPDTPSVRHKFVIAGTLFADYEYAINMREHTMTIK